MREEDIQVFVDIVKKFFDTLGMEEVEIDTPYLADSETPKIAEYTGIIGVSGVHQGIVYMTSSRELLVETLIAMGETDHSEDNIIDLIGEIANTISGNARQEFGSDFHISVPVVFKGGDSKSLTLPKGERLLVIPINFCSQISEIVVCVRTLINNE